MSPPPPPPPSGSPTTWQWEHGVFLCFRGADTREGFTSHLFKALHGSGIDTFMDDRLPKGREISKLLDRIKKSRISVVVFSENFASSHWCLDELVKIRDCNEMMGQEVLPVFYNVPPSDLRHLSGKTGEHLAKHGEEHDVSSEKIERWRHAVKSLADLSGWHYTQGTESRLVSEIVERVYSILNDAGGQSPAGQPEETLKRRDPVRIAILVLQTVFFAPWLFIFLRVVPVVGRTATLVLRIVFWLLLSIVPIVVLKLFKFVRFVLSPRRVRFEQ